MKKYPGLFIALGCSITLLLLANNRNSPTQNNYAKRAGVKYDVARALGWQTSKEGLCHGYFVGTQMLNQKSLKPSKSTATSISTKGPTSLSSRGTSVLRQDVIISQPGRRLRADTVYLYRHPKIIRLRQRSYLATYATNNPA